MNDGDNGSVLLERRTSECSLILSGKMTKSWHPVD